MKKNCIICCIIHLVFCCIISSCATIQSDNIINTEDSNILEDEKKESKENNIENKDLSPIPSNHKSLVEDSQSNLFSDPEILFIDEILPSEEYEQLASTVNISPLILPAPTSKGIAFKKPFSVLVTNTDKSPIASFSITAEFPNSSNKGEIFFSTQEIITNEQGIAEFISPIPQFSCNSFISFYPTPQNHSPEIVKTIQRVSLKAPYQVKTNLLAAGGAICLLDYDSEEKPILDNGRSSSAVLGSLIRSGFSKIGNAEFYEEISSGDENLLYTAVNDLLGSNTAYFIFGTVKYASAPKNNEDGSISITLIAEIKCIDMKTHTILYMTSLEVTGKDNTEYEALLLTRNEKLAPALSEKILYGL